MAHKVLLVQSDPQHLASLKQILLTRGDQVWATCDLAEATSLLAGVRPDLLLLDHRYPGDEWFYFLTRVRQDFPGLGIILTNKSAESQRQHQARRLKAQLFIDPPFTAPAVEQAVAAVKRERLVSGSAPNSAQKTIPMKRGPKHVRLPVRVKITLPYLILALMFALASGYVVSRVAVDEIQSRFYNQLAATGRQSADWFVSEENRLIETLRLVSLTNGVANAIDRADAEQLKSLALPVAINSGDEAIELLDMRGASLLSLRHKAGAGSADFSFTQGDTVYGGWAFVQKVLTGQADSQGNKFSGLVHAPWGDYFYVAGPVYNATGKQVGAILVGKTLRTLANQIRQETLGNVTFYDLQGKPLVSTLFEDNQSASSVPADTVRQTLAGQETTSPVRELAAQSLTYSEILGPWEARGGVDIGILGIAQVQTFLVRTSFATRAEISALVGLAILFVVVVGLYLARMITIPLLKLVNASVEVAHGNLNVKVSEKGDDEVAYLAQSFNNMISGLQEGSIYRDLLGRTVSPEVREQLRDTFASGSFRLAGQQSTATVLMCDIRGFTTISEKSEPETILKWLNEFFGQIVPIVASHGGVVNKFDGDAMLAFFGILPQQLSSRQSALDACDVAVEMVRKINALNTLRQSRGEPPLITGIGLNTGPVIAGGLGTSDRMHYTIIGDTVNTTQRIEALTRAVMDGTGALISQTTYQALGDDQAKFRFESMGAHSVKGKAELVYVYNLLPKGNGSAAAVTGERLDQGAGEKG